MILPSKHINFYESILGLGGLILKLIENEPPLVFEHIWKRIDELNHNRKNNIYYSFDNVVLAIDFLYMIGAINLDKDNNIYKINAVS